MPPKQNKQLDNDFSDLATLPKANIFKFTLVFNKFFTASNRQKVTQKVTESLIPNSGEKIKLITREDIMVYGKAKNLCMDETAAALLPEEDPRKKMSTYELFSRAAADRLFELQVQVRRTKKERITKHEEELTLAREKGEKTPEEMGVLENNLAIVTNEYDLDSMFYLLDFPNCKDEALAFAKYNNSLNGVFQIDEIAAPVHKLDSEEVSQEEDSEENSEASQKVQEQKEAPQEETDPDSVQEQETAQQLLQDFESARKLSAQPSSLRQMAFFKVPFINESVIDEITQDEQGNDVEKKRSAEEVFLQDLICGNIDKYGQYYVQYIKFRNLIQLDPLMPDQKALATLQELMKEEAICQEKKQDAEFQLEEDIANFTQEKEQIPADELEQAEKEFNQHKERLENEIQELIEVSETRLKHIKTLEARKKVSIDEEHTEPAMTKAYQNDFIANPESSNKISSVLSAMVSQIESNSAMKEGSIIGQAISVPEQCPSTSGDSKIDDMFDFFKNEISCDLKLSTRKPEPEVDYVSQTSSLQVKYNTGFKLQEEEDRSLEVQQSLPLKLLEKEQMRAQEITQRENLVLENITLPGKDRHLMPSIPSKSKRARDSENPNFYPFCTLSHESTERVMLLRALQQMVRMNSIDKTQSLEAKHSKFKVFERCFENHMKPEIYRQTFSEALLDDPEVSTMYYQRTDALIVALYHKNNLPIDTHLPMGDNLDGDRNWRASYRVLPDFQNWLAHFADELVFEQEGTPIAVQPSTKDLSSSQPNLDGTGKAPTQKFQMDEDAMPERMLDVEDDKIQNINEKSGFLYPDDNSIMRVDHFQVGGEKFTKSLIYKDNLRFGLRQKTASSQQEEQDYGLVKYQPVGDTEFWLKFENGTRLGVEQVCLNRIKQETIRIDPPPPTPEEIAAKEEATKLYQAALAKQRGNKNPQPIDIKIPETPQPKYEEGPWNHLDELFNDDIVDQTTSLATLTLNNGLYVQYLGNGQIAQFPQDRSCSEVNRIVTKDGAVIRQLQNRNAEVLYPNGEVARFDKKQMKWTIINVLGKVQEFKDGVLRDSSAIPTATETDPISLSKTTFREDNVCSVYYTDGSVFTKHADGTQMHTKDGEIRVEKAGFASHVIRQLSSEEQNRYEESKPFIGGIFKNLTPESFRNPQERAVNGRIIETYLPDGAMSQTFLDYVQTKKRGEQDRWRHVIKRPDLSVIVIDSSGHVSLITSNSRASLAESSSRKTVSNQIDDTEEFDRDYFYELSRPSGQFTPGVYQVHISAEPKKSKIKTKNYHNDTLFTLRHNNTLEKQEFLQTEGIASGSRELKPCSSSKTLIRPEIIGDMELENTGTHKNPLTRQYQYPRFFIISGDDGSAREMLSQDQLAYAIRQKKAAVDQSIKQKMMDVVNNTTVENMYFITKVQTMKETEIENRKLRGLEFPQNAQDSLEKEEDIKEEEEIALQLPRQQQYLFKQVFRMEDIDIFSQRAFAEDLKRFQAWRTSQIRFNTEFGIVHRKKGEGPPRKKKDLLEDRSMSLDSDQIEDQEFQNKRTALKVLRFRAKPFIKIQPEEFKNKSILNIGTSDACTNFQGKVNRNHEELLSRGSKRSRKLSENLMKSARTKSDANEDLEEEFEEKDSLELEQEKEAKEKLETEKKNKDEARINRLLTKLSMKEEMKSTPQFVSSYFETKNGQAYLEEYPPQEISPEVIARMQMRIKRAEKNSSQDQSLQSNDKIQDLDNEGKSKDNPIVSLEPEENLKKNSAVLATKSISQQQKSMSENEAPNQQAGPSKSGYVDPTLVPSIFAQEKIYLAQKEKEECLRNEEHHIVKTKEFNVYGRIRDHMPKVKAIQKSTAASDLNEKFITTECITDRRVKTASMATRHYAQAPSVENVRKQGQHQMILGAINRKQTFAELINQANSMVTGVLHDPLKRSMNVLPSTCTFGGVRAGTINEIIVTVKNEDSVGHRIQIKPIEDKRIAIQQLEHGIIAPGMIRKISVQIRAAEDSTEQSINTALQIVCKHEVFKIPITAQIHLFENFETAHNKHMAEIGRPLQNSRVRERLMRQVEVSRSEQESGPELLTKKPDEVSSYSASEQSQM